MEQETTRTKTACTPNDLLPHEDVDYAATFARLAALNQQMGRRGATPARILQRSNLFFALGDYEQSARDAGLVAFEEEDHAEAHYLRGRALLAQSARRMGLAPAACGLAARGDDGDTLDLLAAAMRAFRRALAANDADEEARSGLDAARRLASSHAHAREGVWRNRWRAA